MAKNIMISNRIYDELKKIKGNKSFSEVIAETLEKSGEKRKTIADVLACAGTLHGFREDKEATAWLEKAWKKWDKRLNRDMEKDSF